MIRMDKQEYRKNAGDMLYLAACAINGRTPSAGRISRMDLDSVFYVCEKHCLTAAAAYGLEAAGVKHPDFVQAKEKAVRKNILLDVERGSILRRLEAEGIWYMPLKGVLLKDWYPKLGMRQMSDNDILFDSEKRERVREIMEELGFTCDHYGVGWDDAYFKEPVSNFEMHVELFTVNHEDKLYNYYRNVKERLIKDKKNNFGYHFSDEDFYIYITAHEYKHFIKGGTGVRSLLDAFIYMNRFGDKLDREYIDAELGKLGIAEFEKSNRELAMKLFSFEKLSNEDKKVLDYYVTSGTYGTVKHKVDNADSKLKFVMKRIIPPMEIIQVYYPFVYRHKYLLPFLQVYRFFKAVSVSRHKVVAELRALIK